MFAKILISLLLLMAGASLARAGDLNEAQKRWYGARLADNARGVFTPPATDPASAPAADALAERIVQWDRLRRDEYKPGFNEVATFLAANPGWPLERELRVKAEAAIQISFDSPQGVDLFFNRFPPITSIGKLRRAEALLALGQRDAAGSLARDAWEDGSFAPDEEQRILAQFGWALSAQDHADRADRLIWTGSTTAAARLLALLPADRVALTAARIALRTRAKDAQDKLAQVPATLRNHAGLIYDQALWLRATKSDTAASDLLLATKINPREVQRPRAWAALLQALSKQALDAGEDERAYRLLAEHSMAENVADVADDDEADRVAYVETEWRAGWIALRHLKRPQDAIRHFAAMQPVARSPITLARSAYWSGRAAEAMNNGAMAQSWYQRASQFPDVFYGQLAADTLGRPIAPPDLTPPPLDRAEMQAFLASDVVQAARMLGALGQNDTQSLFIGALARRAETPGEKRVAADLAHEIQRLDLGVRIGKLARLKGIGLAYASYPRIALPGSVTASWSLVHAITRQESQFNQRAVSRAGARGLMQLMPGTARAESGKLGLDFMLSKLTEDPVYNMTLGASYFQRRLDGFNGSHVLAIAAYNAGAGNVNKWLVANGDPREPGVDVLDWIEQIPFRETRDYVMRVLENAVVYQTLDPARRGQSNLYLLSTLLGRTNKPA